MCRFSIQDVTNMDNSEESNVNNILGLVYGVYRHFQQHLIFSCYSGLLVEETGVLGQIHRPVASQ